jgi:hypothetical protein
LTLTLALLVVSVTLLAARAEPTRAVPMTTYALHAFSLEDPPECPSHTGYALVSVADDLATYRYVDQNAAGMVCVRLAQTRLPSSVLIDDDVGGDLNGSTPPFVLLSLERLPNRALVSNARLVDRDGNSLICLYQTAEPSAVVVIDNSSGTLNG